MKRALFVVLPLAACGGDFFAADDFTYSDEGWELESAFSEPTMSIVKDDLNGEPPFICGEDSGFTGAARWRFRAPGKYVGNASRAFKQRMTWSAMTTFQSGRLYSDNDVFLTGRGIAIVAAIPDTPRGTREWAQFSVYLDARTPWRKEATGFPLATDAEIEAVLRTLTEVKLPGEWRDGNETSCIDNVYFGTP